MEAGSLLQRGSATFLREVALQTPHVPGRGRPVAQSWALNAHTDASPPGNYLLPSTASVSHANGLGVWLNLIMFRNKNFHQEMVQKRMDAAAGQIRHGVGAGAGTFN